MYNITSSLLSKIIKDLSIKHSLDKRLTKKLVLKVLNFFIRTKQKFNKTVFYKIFENRLKYYDIK